MANNQKPLHPYEQSMLLVAMLFDSKNLPEILKVLPDEQCERMNIAKDKFLSLARNERMTEIVLELRRLLLIDEYRINWIHQSWIDQALSMEPAYLRPFITDSIRERAKGKESEAYENQIPLPLIFSTFIDQLIKTPQKTAIYNPILMRLHSLNDDAQEEIFSSIGRFSISALLSAAESERLKRYLFRKGLTDLLPKSPVSQGKNPFGTEKFRKFFIRQLIQFKPFLNISCEVFAGLIMTAFYLSGHKHQWQRATTLGLHLNLGRMIEQTILLAANININQAEHAMLSNFLNASLNQVKR